MKYNKSIKNTRKRMKMNKNKKTRKVKTYKKIFRKKTCKKGGFLGFLTPALNTVPPTYTPPAFVPNQTNRWVKPITTNENMFQPSSSNFIGPPLKPPTRKYVTFFPDDESNNNQNYNKRKNNEDQQDMNVINDANPYHETNIIGTYKEATERDNNINKLLYGDPKMEKKLTRTADYPNYLDYPNYNNYYNM
jgi:hypothetical protein